MKCHTRGSGKSLQVFRNSFNKIPLGIYEVKIKGEKTWSTDINVNIYDINLRQLCFATPKTFGHIPRALALKPIFVIFSQLVPTTLLKVYPFLIRIDYFTRQMIDFHQLSKITCFCSSPFSWPFIRSFWKWADNSRMKTLFLDRPARK